MNIVRDCPAARSLPSRRHFALARLISLLRFRTKDSGAPMTFDRLALTIDRDQDAVEIYTVAAWFFVTAAWYVAVLLPLRIAFAVPVSIVITPIILELPTYITGAVLVPLWNVVAGTKIENNQKLNSVTLMTLMAVASSYFGAMASPARYVAWFFFAVLVVNATAWVLMASLQGQVREMERRCGP